MKIPSGRQRGVDLCEKRRSPVFEGFAARKVFVNSSPNLTSCRPSGALRRTSSGPAYASRTALCIQGAADDVVTHTRQILNTAAADHDDGVLLQVVADARDIGRDLHPVGQTHTGNLTQGGIRLLRGRRLHCRADAALLRGILVDGRAFLAFQPRKRAGALAFFSTTSRPV